MRLRQFAPLFALALALAACNSEPPRERVLRVYNWSDYIAEDTVANFERATGIRVVYEVYDRNETLEQKVLPGGSGYDVVFPSARPFAQRQIQAGVYAVLDRSQLPQLGNLDAGLLSGLQDVDPGNAHALPYMWGTTGLALNVDKVRALLGEDVELDSWNLLFDPHNAARLAECGIAVLDDEQEALGAALILAGRNPNDFGDDELKLATDAWLAIRPHVRYIDSSRYIDDLANGDICLAMAYSGDAFQARDRADQANNGVRIAYVLPREGAMRWVDLMAIPRDAANVAEAHAFINYLLTPRVAADITNHVAYANPNTAATALVDPEISGDPGVYPPEAVRAKLVDPKTLPAEVAAQRVAAWTAIKDATTSDATTP